MMATESFASCGLERTRTRAARSCEAAPDRAVRTPRPRDAHTRAARELRGAHAVRRAAEREVAACERRRLGAAAPPRCHRRGASARARAPILRYEGSGPGAHAANNARTASESRRLCVPVSLRSASSSCSSLEDCNDAPHAEHALSGAARSAERSRPIWHREKSRDASERCHSCFCHAWRPAGQSASTGKLAIAEWPLEKSLGA